MKNNFEQRVQVTLKALKNPPGKWGTPSWTWNGIASASAKFVCSNDKSHVKTVKATITSKTTKATCTTDGKTVYTATVTLNGKTYTDTKTVTITKTGHKFSAWKTTAFDTDKNTSTQTRTCSACNKTESRTIENAIQRLAGATRYGTATAIAEKLSEKPTDIFFVFVGNYPDALSASAAAAAKNAHIIYLTKDGELNADTAKYLAKLKKAGSVKNAYVFGGTGAVSDEFVKVIANAGV